MIPIASPRPRERAHVSRAHRALQEPQHQRGQARHIHLAVLSGEEIAHQHRTEHVGESAEHHALAGETQRAQVEHHEDAGQHDVYEQLVAKRAVHRKQKLEDGRGKERVAVRRVQERKPAQNVRIPLGKLVELLHELHQERAKEEPGRNRVRSVQNLRAEEVVGEQNDDEHGEQDFEERAAKETKPERGLGLGTRAPLVPHGVALLAHAGLLARRSSPFTPALRFRSRRVPSRSLRELAPSETVCRAR